MNIPRDKQLHFAGGVFTSVVMIIAFVTARLYGLHWGTLMAGVMHGLGKEVIDKIAKSGTPDWLDFAYTVAGSAVLSFLVYMAVRGIP